THSQPGCFGSLIVMVPPEVLVALGQLSGRRRISVQSTSFHDPVSTGRRLRVTPSVRRGRAQARRPRPAPGRFDAVARGALPGAGGGTIGRSPRGSGDRETLGP